MVKTPSFKRVIMRAVLRQVSPMVIRLVSVSDQMLLDEFHDVLRTILGMERRSRLPHSCAHRVEGGRSEHRSKTARTRTSAT